MSQFDAPPSVPGIIVRPHRGTTVLTLGILGIVFTLLCGFGWILGIIAWVLGNADLKAMAAGQMDPSGEGNTNAGKICGIVSVALAVLGLIIYIVFAILGIAILGASAAAGQNP